MPFLAPIQQMLLAQLMLYRPLQLLNGKGRRCLLHLIAYASIHSMRWFGHVEYEDEADWVRHYLMI